MDVYKCKPSCGDMNTNKEYHLGGVSEMTHPKYKVLYYYVLYYNRGIIIIYLCMNKKKYISYRGDGIKSLFELLHEKLTSIE